MKSKISKADSFKLIFKHRTLAKNLMKVSNFKVKSKSKQNY